MYFKVVNARSFKSFISNKSCFSVTERFILEETKLIRNELLSIFLIAKVASVGMFGLSVIICIANSLTESIIAENSLSFLAGRASLTSLIVAFK